MSEWVKCVSGHELVSQRNELVKWVKYVNEWVIDWVSDTEHVIIMDLITY